MWDNFVLLRVFIELYAIFGQRKAEKKKKF
jgi:hypothetical protein